MTISFRHGKMIKQETEAKAVIAAHKALFAPKKKAVAAKKAPAAKK
jgi:hypothetical protein